MPSPAAAVTIGGRETLKNRKKKEINVALFAPQRPLLLVERLKKTPAMFREYMRKQKQKERARAPRI